MGKRNIVAAGIAAAALSAGAAMATPVDFYDGGSIGTEGTYVFDTVGSVFTAGSVGNVDTELALWDASGTLIAANDDGGPGLFSQITATLTAGIYYLGITEYNAGFSNGFNVSCFNCFERGEVADLALNVNGTLLDFRSAGDATRLETAFFQVEVSPVPLPAGIPLLATGFAVLGLMRHRRKADKA